MVETSIVNEVSIAQSRGRIQYALLDFKNYIKVNGFKREELANQIGVSKKYVDDLLTDRVSGIGAIETYQKLMNITGYKGENIYIGK
ncbi:hypothetical protein [Weissella ceti]|uniref:HTH cro/C1-type domain-containing protein n=1 Tax=Weissella ceti TaxID=759620 RepID=A0A088GLH9_9LACO|nr:hypothetical protein [Weissella ceti]AIM63112.1 hypothetical protein WS74_0860 [Weissella ceti]